MRLIATFGVDGKNAGKYVIVHADSEHQAMVKLNEKYGQDGWSMLYATEEGAGVTRWGLKLLEEIH